MKARFQIENVNETQPALASHAVFSQRGGLIGAGAESTWQLQDIDRSVPETAARVVVRDGHFTIEALSGARILINEASAPVPMGRPVILSDRDRLRIGALDIVVTMASDPESEKIRADGPFGGLVGGKAKQGDGLLIDAEYSVREETYVGQSQPGEVDPITVLDQDNAVSRTGDPLDAIAAVQEQDDHESEKVISEAVRKPAVNQDSIEMADKADMHFASMPHVRVRRDRYGFEEVSQGEDAKQRDDETIENLDAVDHIALRPLARRLGIQIGDIPASQAARLLADIGGALRAALAGLNRIYREHGQRKGNFPLATLHLHALEDNPLRFSEDPETALHAFFSKRGPVHLSAPAAVEETMEHLYTHQLAVEEAIDRALDSVLAALSPKALERRFNAYETEAVPQDQQAYEAWCWRMYRAYFTELRSERQRGLQMLFWEVFAQEYQVEMRRAERMRDDEELEAS